MSALTFLEYGKSPYQIVIAKEAIPSEKYAAEELQRYVEKIGGVKLPIVTDDAKPSSHEIVLGINSHLRNPKLQKEFAQLGSDGFILKTDGKRVLICGGQPRGTYRRLYFIGGKARSPLVHTGIGDISSDQSYPAPEPERNQDSGARIS